MLPSRRSQLALVGLLSVLAAGPAIAERDTAAPKIRHVVIVSVDGLRPDAITKDATPHHAKLAAEGISARSAMTIAKSLTLPSHASMLSGVDVGAHGLSWNSYQPSWGFIRVPTVFTMAEKHGLSTAMFVGKDKLRHLAKPGAIDAFEMPSDPKCAGVASAAATYFTKHQPQLLFVHFADPDDAGHAFGWGSTGYKAAVKIADSCLGTLVAAVDKIAAASALIIVTADHGGEGSSHASGSKEARRIPWMARGPGIAAGSTIDATVDTFDTAATALAALGLPALPKMRGTSRLPAPTRSSASSAADTRTSK